MSLPQDILIEAKKLKEKFKYTSDPKVVRNPDGSLNFDDDKMDCSEFFLKTVKNVNADLYSKLIEKMPGGKEGGNTKTIQKGIKEIEGITNLTELKQDNPEVSDWLLWQGHIEMVQEITTAGRIITLGANGKTNDAVPKNIDFKNFDSAKKMAADFLGVWTPKLSNELSLLARVQQLELMMGELSSRFPAGLFNQNEVADADVAFGPVSDLKTPVDLKKDNVNASMEAAPPQGQAFPLYQGTNMPFNTSNDSTEKIKSFTRIINFLKVSNAAHKRYYPGDGKTFCNIYVYDLCYLLGAAINKFYVPRVWWTDAAVNQINNGNPQTPVYGITLREMSANDLHHWFQVFGDNFGWVAQSDLDALQQQVNTTGNPGIIVGKKVGSHGHITVVVPEPSVPGGAIKAVRNTQNKVINPLQSQAGANNFEFGSSTIQGKPWFTIDHLSAFYIFNP